MKAERKRVSLNRPNLARQGCFITRWPRLRGWWREMPSHPHFAVFGQSVDFGSGKWYISCNDIWNHSNSSITWFHCSISSNNIIKPRAIWIWVSETSEDEGRELASDAKHHYRMIRMISMIIARVLSIFSWVTSIAGVAYWGSARRSFPWSHHPAICVPGKSCR